MPQKEWVKALLCRWIWGEWGWGKCGRNGIQDNDSDDVLLAILTLLFSQELYFLPFLPLLNSTGMSQQSSMGSVGERDMWEQLRWSDRFIVIMQEDTENNAIGENKNGINWVNCLK